ncbi:T9SS type A sorting domain-containing protein [Flavobacterium sp. J372]|uniref:T9SS type A sorting domain-containing protein n=1 Tax=Flavobacterium sp. J372 TaxID=2898436 RepID=UPI002151CD93|nr:T9SS type A sorting domain-containing protein [Flavobacterium sp. J372]MCR5860676.1 T9SS type A sorting domain-containing protein [Flavobacterium sp. J372]
MPFITLAGNVNRASILYIGVIAGKIKPKANVQLGDTLAQAHFNYELITTLGRQQRLTPPPDRRSSSTVTVYPVPSKNILNIKANTGIARIEIYNQAGQRA